MRNGHYLLPPLRPELQAVYDEVLVDRVWAMIRRPE